MTDFTIDNLPRTAGIGTFGEDAPFEAGISAFYGQSFVAPSDGPVEALSLTFDLETYPRDPQQGPLKYRVMLVPTVMQNPYDTWLSEALYASGPLTFPDHTPWTELTVDLGATPLAGGQTYLWVLDGYSDRNGLTGDAEVGTHNGYAGGTMYYGGKLDASGAPLSSIGLGEFSGVDLAFRMTLTSAPDPAPLAASAVPEPATWALMLFGFVALAINKRRLANGRFDRKILGVPILPRRYV